MLAGGEDGRGSGWGETEAAGNRDPEWSEVRSGDSGWTREGHLRSSVRRSESQDSDLCIYLANVYSVFHKTSNEASPAYMVQWPTTFAFECSQPVGRSNHT